MVLYDEHPDCYCERWEKYFVGMLFKDAVHLACKCVVHAGDLPESAPEHHVIHNAIGVVRDYLSHSDVNELRMTLGAQLETLRNAQSRASELYDNIEGMKDVEHASPSGRMAFRSDALLSALTNLYVALLDESDNASLAWPVLLAWQATLFSKSERDWQCGLVS